MSFFNFDFYPITTEKRVPSKEFFISERLVPSEELAPLEELVIPAKAGIQLNPQNLNKTGLNKICGGGRN